jgi:hypothetical protein
MANANAIMALAVFESGVDEKHLKVLVKRFGSSVREHVAMERVTVGGVDSGLAVSWDVGFPEYMTLTQRPSKCCKKNAAVRAIVKRAADRVRKHGAVGTHIFCGDSVKAALARRFTVLRMDDDFMVLLRKTTARRSGEMDCVLVVGWDGDTDDAAHEVAVRGDDHVVIPNTKMRAEGGFWCCVNRVTVARRRVVIKTLKNGWTKAVLDRPVCTYAKRVDDVVVRFRVADCPAVPAHRANKLTATLKKMPICLTQSTKLVYIESLNVSPPGEVFKGRSATTEEFRAGLMAAKSTLQNRMATVIQRAWRRVSNDPHRRIGARVVRSRFTKM